MENMRKTTLTVILLLTLLLTACGTQASATGTPAAESLPAAAELALGTFKLEGTQQAVTTEQAAELLPLWQVYQSLTTSDTAAQAEIEALVEQIEGTMTSNQLQTIEALNLTQQDVMKVMAEQNIVESAPQPAASSTNSNASAAPEGDMPPADMGGGDPAMMGGIQPLSGSNTSADTTSAGASGTATSAVPSTLVNALIQLLESRTA